MEQYLLIALLISLIILIISFIIIITDYSIFKKNIERILDKNIEVNNHAKEVINITSSVNKSVGEICKLNSRLITNIRNLLEKNVYLTNKLEEKEEDEE